MKKKIIKNPKSNHRDSQPTVSTIGRWTSGPGQPLAEKSRTKSSVLFMGTPEFAVPILENLIKEKYKIKAIITQPNKETGRKKIITSPPVKKLAQKYKIPVYQPKNKEELIKDVLSLNPDLIIVAAYGIILPKEVIETPKIGIINVHASLLPKLRGPSPINYAILEGGFHTGITIIELVEKMDAGLIIAQEKIRIDPKDTTLTLSKKLSKLGADLLMETIPRYIEGKTKKVKQKEDEATYSKIIKKEDGKIDWNKSAIEIERQIRAYIPWPTAYTFWRNKRIKILDAWIISENKSKNPGEVLDNKKEFLVQTGDGIINIKKLQLEGKKEITGEEFLRGYPRIIETILDKKH